MTEFSWTRTSSVSGSTIVRRAFDSDNWPITWADDGYLYVNRIDTAHVPNHYVCPWVETAVYRADTGQLIDRLVDRYFTVDCAIFTPNPTRCEHARQIVRDAQADGVIHYALQFCTPYQMEAPAMERQLEGEGLPVLRLDTDYSQEDVEQLRTRVEAFVEQLRG